MAAPEANIPPDIARPHLDRILAGLPALQDYLAELARRHGDALMDAYRRVRRATRQTAVNQHIDLSSPWTSSASPCTFLSSEKSAVKPGANRGQKGESMGETTATLSEADRQIAEDLKRRLLPHDGERVRRVIVYGSRVRGAATRDSDFDLLVVEADPVSKREEMQRLAEAVKGIGVPVDVWVMGEMEFEETKNVIGGLAYPAHKYGVVLYENA